MPIVKYSFIMPYHRRAEQLISTLDSFVHHYEQRNDFEVVIVEDLKNEEMADEHGMLTNAINIYCRNFPIVYTKAVVKDTWNPAMAFNIGASHSSGEFLIITNPEVMHEVDVLSGFDAEFKNPDVYVVCSCKSVKVSRMKLQELYRHKFVWYQHSVHRNARIHFCSAISKHNYLDIGGFDDEYTMGMGFDDDDFRNSVENAGIKFVLRDDLTTVHLHHTNSKAPHAHKLYTINKAYYLEKWGKNAETAESKHV